MKIGVLGTGMVGNAIASKLVALGHEVMMGSRTSDNPKAQTWAKTARGTGRVGTFAETSVFGDMVFNCTQGIGSLAALQAAGAANLDGKILVDVANVLTREGPGQESLGEQIQKAFPQAKVVKTLNTINCELMVAPERLCGAHSVFLSGNDTGVKERVRDLLGSFGWKDIIDLGDISTARATEGYVPLWVSLWKQLGTPTFNINVVR
jgi:8-hydroxy-5-deazaflavin:NADPH oxidoreductase